MEALALLEYDEEDLRRRVSEEALPKYVDVIIDRQLTQQESSTLALFKQRCAIDRILIHSGTDFHVNEFIPPTGYAATFHEDTTFSPALFERPFRILVSCPVELKGRIRDVEIARWKRALNATIPDVSPRPPIYGKSTIKGGDWSPSLGSMSWIGVGEQHQYMGVMQTRCVYVICTPDKQTLADLNDRFYYLRKSSHKEVQPIMDWLREIVRETGRRLLYMACTAMGLPTSQEVHQGDTPYPEQTIEEWQGQWLFDCGVQVATQVPACIVFPKQVPHECPPYPDMEPTQLEPLQFDPVVRSLVPEFEVFLDDIVPYPYTPNHLVRLSDCCRRQGVMARVMGPEDEVCIYTHDDQEDKAANERWLFAFPCQSKLIKRRPDEEESEVETTSLSGPYLKTYSYERFEKLREGFDKDIGVVSLTPVFVRVTTIPPFDEL
jgi:hypothetical protein